MSGLASVVLAPDLGLVQGETDSILHRIRKPLLVLSARSDPFDRSQGLASHGGL